jgi:hypothetical protein
MKNIKWVFVGLMVVFSLVSMRPAFAGEVQDRIDNQEKRIDQGVNSAQLTPTEAANLEAREAQIEKNRQKALADGKMTKAERRNLNRQENKQSRKIYRKKHNARTDQPVTTSPAVTTNK